MGAVSGQPAVLCRVSMHQQSISAVWPVGLSSERQDDLDRKAAMLEQGLRNGTTKPLLVYCQARCNRAALVQVLRLTEHQVRSEIESPSLVSTGMSDRQA
jgi:hypothetical protein